MSERGTNGCAVCRTAAAGLPTPGYTHTCRVEVPVEVLEQAIEAMYEARTYLLRSEWEACGIGKAEQALRAALQGEGAGK